MYDYENSLDMSIVEVFDDDLKATADYLQDKFGSEYKEATMELILQKLENGEYD